MPIVIRDDNPKGKDISVNLKGSTSTTEQGTLSAASSNLSELGLSATPPLSGTSSVVSSAIAPGTLSFGTSSPELRISAPTSQALSQTSTTDDPLGKYTVLLQDPLSEVTRKERRTLLGVSILSIALVKAHLVPNEISALGMKMSQINEQALVYILLAIVLYFITTFSAYAFPDFVIWKINLWKGIKAAVLERMNAPNFDDKNIAELIGADAKMSSWASWAGFPSVVRGIFDFALPVLVGILAVYFLLSYIPPAEAPPSKQPAEVLILPPL